MYTREIVSALAMLSVDEALARILALCQGSGTEQAEVGAAIGRGLGLDVLALRTLPPWDNSAMDGYAVSAEDTLGAPVRLRVVETLYAGHRATRAVQAGECARIMTGAALPAGANAVVMQEKTRRSEGASEVEVLEAVTPGHFVRRAGEDARAGDLLLARGVSLGIPEAGLLWGQGVGTVVVPRRPTVAILSTGDELCAVGEPPGDKIVDTNGPSLAAAARRAGAEVRTLGIAPDRLEDLVAKLEQTTWDDVVLTSAGVSVGEHDYVREALARVGAQMDFWKVAIKPGKPLAVGHRGKTLFFGLPGNPTSSLVSFELFVRPALRRLLGHAQVTPPRYPGRLEGSCPPAAAGMTHFVRATATYRDGAWWARPLASQTSGALRSAAAATHLIVVPPGAQKLASGDPVELIPVSWAG